jgi:D-lactate dehydrogenase (cytochrome)
MQVMEAMTALGGSDEDTWYATTDRELEPLRAFRHAVPEAVNLLIGERKRSCPELTKLGTDMSSPDAALEQVMAMYRTGLTEAGLESVIFGHIGNNHLHVNILPNSMDEYDKGKALYQSWARRIVSLGGSVSAEHGIGKIKVPFLQMMYTPECIAQMRRVKAIFDPSMMLNPGDLFS